MSRTALFASALALAILGGGCDMGLQDKLNEQRQLRYTKAVEAVFAVEAARSEMLAESLPAADAEFDGEEHPLLTWRKQVLERADDRTLEQLAQRAEWEDTRVGVRGTPAQLAADHGASFAKEAAAYWSGGSSLQRYVDFISSFLESIAREEKAVAACPKDAAEYREDEPSPEARRYLTYLRSFRKNITPAAAAAACQDGGYVPSPFLDEARFDLVFAHAARFYQITKLGPRASVLASVQPDWEVAFSFPRRGREDFQSFVSRLCFVHPSLRERCEGVPHELRARVIDRPFLEWLKAKADAYQSTAEQNKVFADLVARFAGSLDEALEAELRTEEVIPLPSTIAPPVGVSGLPVIVAPDIGIVIGDVQVATELRGRVPADLPTHAQNIVDTIRNTPGNRINFERVVIEASRDISTAELRDLTRAFLHPEGIVRQVIYVGRRRADHSMRQAAMTLRLPRPQDSRSFVYQFSDDPARTTCALMGFMGEAPLGARDEYYLEIGPTRIRAASASFDRETKSWTVGETVQLGSPTDLDPLDAWLAEHTGEINVFLDASFRYEDTSMFLSRILHTCSDEEVPVGGQSEPMTRPCGKSESRENTINLAFCG